MIKDPSTGLIRYYGRIVCPVLDNLDPQGKGRIRIKHPIFGNSGWIYYLRAPGSFDVPNIKDLVYVEAEWGNAQYLVAWGNMTKGSVTVSIPAQFKRISPTNRGLFTPAGNTIELDDGVDLAVDTGTPQIGIRLTTPSGAQINVNDTASTVSISDPTNTSYISINWKTGTVTLNAPSIKLGATASHAVILGDTFETLFNAHKHDAGTYTSPSGSVTGSSGAVTSGTQLTGTELSTIVKTE